MARHEGGVTAYAETLKSYHRQMDYLDDQKQYHYAMNKESVELYRRVLFDAIDNLCIATALFSHWQQEKGYLRRRPVQRFLIRRMVASTLAKTTKALKQFRVVEAQLKDFPRG